MATTPAAAYETFGDDEAFAGTGQVRWSESKISLDVRERGLLDLDLVKKAAQAWEDVECSSVDFSVQSSTTKGEAGDGANSVEWVTDWEARGWDSALPAFTDSEFTLDESGAWTIVEADVYINVEHFKDESQLSVLKAVIAHELGHVLGLQHPCEVVASETVPACSYPFDEVLMHPLYGPERTLPSPDDEAGACFLYPKADACSSTSDEGCTERAEAGDDCDRDADCQLTLRCVDGLCSRGDVPLGGSCESSFDCVNGACVGYCAELCVENADCGAGEHCVRTDDDFGGCVGSDRTEPVGASCTAADLCASGLCRLAADGSGVCTTKCQAPADCPAGWACSTNVDDQGEQPTCTPPDRTDSGWTCGVAGSSSPGSSWLWALWGPCGCAVRFWRRRSFGVTTGSET